MSYTENLADFGFHEREEFIKILMLWQRDGLPEQFYEGGVRIAMNASSGYVFLTNEDYQCCMRNGDHLEMWYTLGHSGYEGFLADLIGDWDSLDDEDKEELWQIAQQDGYEIALRNDSREGAVCYSSSFEEFGIVKGENTAWFPSCGSTDVLFVDVDALPNPYIVQIRNLCVSVFPMQRQMHESILQASRRA